MQLTLVRHGQTHSNVRGLLDTAPPGPALNELGRTQAEALPNTFANARIDAIFSSHQRRAQETAVPLAAARSLTVHTLADLREISAGDLEMRGDRPSVDRYMRVLFDWLGGDLRQRIPGGPNAEEVLDRMEGAIETIADQLDGDGAAVAVGHSAAIQLWVALRTVNLTAEWARTTHLDNTGRVVLERDGRRWRAISWTDGPVSQPVTV